MQRFRNVIVFGDSFSDIGKKRYTCMGRFAQKTGLMVTNPSGRYSDCRNWADYMFEDATGASIIGGSAKETIARSRQYMHLGAADPVRGTHPDSWFNYANYAEGGATGCRVPWNWRMLGTFKDQVSDFTKDYRAFMRRRTYNRRAKGAQEPDAPDKTLFLVWFGANDVYTAGRDVRHISEVAYAVSNTQRQRLAALVGPASARFVFFSVPRPKTALRYRAAVNGFADRKMTRLVRQYEEAAVEYNRYIKNNAASHGDIYIDVNECLDPAVVADRAWRYALQVNHFQPSGHSNVHRAPSHPDLAARAPQCAVTADRAHPSDRMYQYAWDHFHTVLKNKGVRFGNIGPHVPDRVVSIERRVRGDEAVTHRPQMMEAPPRRASI